MSSPVPYPADTRAKGWRFELDHERIEQSDTWALAPAEMKPWLLMLWLTAWKQTPCGSLPAADELVAARIGMQPKVFAKNRACLMRGWWLAEDGRLYHDTIAQRVLEMLESRRKNAARVANHAAKKRHSQGANALAMGDDNGTYDTGTGTGTGPSPSLRSGESTRAGDVCKAMKAAGLQAVSHSHPKLKALLDAGITVDELADAARTAVDGGKPFAYALAVAEGRRRDAAIEPLPAGTPAADPDSRSAVEAEGIAKGVGKWNEIEQWAVYLARVRGPQKPSLSLADLSNMAAQRQGVH